MGNGGEAERRWWCYLGFWGRGGPGFRRGRGKVQRLRGVLNVNSHNSAFVIAVDDHTLLNFTRIYDENSKSRRDD
jgi:hypothetical protein